MIPTLYGFYEVWGILRLLALEPVGNAICEDGKIDQALRMRMKAALQRIHNAGFVHGDIARRNFCRTGSDVFLVDLERCQPSGNPSDMVDEMNEVDRLYMLRLTVTCISLAPVHFQTGCIIYRLPIVVHCTLLLTMELRRNTSCSGVS